MQGVLNVFKGRPFDESKYKITTALVKFNSVLGRVYEKKGDQITLKFFEDERDFTIAEEVITKNLDLLESLGSKPILISLILRLLTGIPYKKSKVKGYVKNFSRRTLLSEQHLAGGCIFGDVIDKGITDAYKTGQVIGSDNIHVADLSAVPLPRISTQTTAYLVGHHGGKQLYAPNRKKRISDNQLGLGLSFALIADRGRIVALELTTLKQVWILVIRFSCIMGIRFRG